jgi:predicted PhzF superfamily epimerase YddE/YHI9
MKLPLYQIDAFATELFTGNPAAVCLLKSWLPDALMQSIAAENNLAETAFVVSNDQGFHIRWFTPQVEVRLCGHATLASAHVLIQHVGISGNEVAFHSHLSGKLTVCKQHDLYVLNFPSDPCVEIGEPGDVLKCLNHSPVQSFRGETDVMLIFETQQQIETMEPDFSLLKRVDARALIVTAPGSDCDFVSRFFAPQVGIDEDPVTGSAHTTLIPYWSKRLGKSELLAKQLSRRGGILYCNDLGDRVEIGGHARTYLVGEIAIATD